MAQKSSWESWNSNSRSGGTIKDGDHPAPRALLPRSSSPKIPMGSPVSFVPGEQKPPQGNSATGEPRTSQADSVTRESCFRGPQFPHIQAAGQINTFGEAQEFHPHLLPSNSSSPQKGSQAQPMEVVVR